MKCLYMSLRYLACVQPLSCQLLPEAEVSKTLKTTLNSILSSILAAVWLLLFFPLTTPRSTVGMVSYGYWIVPGFPDRTLRTTAEKVQFLFNLNFHKSFFLQTLGAARTKNNAGATFHSFVWCDNVSGSSKMSNREFGQCFVWSLNLFSTQQ